MKRITPQLIILIALWIAIPALAAPAAAQGVQGSISGHVTTVHDVNMSQINVILVNASNMSQDISGFNATPDSGGFFQFTHVPAGDYKAFAWGPYLAAGMSSNITVADNVTYNCAIVLKPEPYYGNTTVSQNYIPLGGATTQLTITVYDYWENPVGPGIMISTHTTAGTLNPLYGETDANSQFATTLTSPENGSYAEVQEFARGWNGTYYPLQKRVQVVNVTPTPAPTASPTTAPSATPTPVATPPSSITSTPTLAPTSAPASTPTSTPAPGFEALLALISVCATAAIVTAIAREK